MSCFILDHYVWLPPQWEEIQMTWASVGGTTVKVFTHVDYSESHTTQPFNNIHISKPEVIELG